VVGLTYFAFQMAYILVEESYFTTIKKSFTFITVVKELDHHAMHLYLLTLNANQLLKSFSLDKSNCC